ncbi:DUF3307 domain-containing protein [Sulfitobacter noctilucicola]|uniref:DUF3307 domain-containing protein n=1 Tax=Sulfitobacter noctilucicola TaxID=1342301 RepID=UPI00288A9018|nr:DUF3307 domain-containing protein [Sulfitobacter noctilucicola]
MLLTLLQVKHLFADFFLQTPRMLADRAVYLHFGRAEHAFLHGVLSFVALVLVGAPLVFSVVIGLVEWVVHFHIDWIKGRYSEQALHTPADASYWRAFGADQLAHQLTYIVIIWCWGLYAF